MIFLLLISLFLQCTQATPYILFATQAQTQGRFNGNALCQAQASLQGLGSNGVNWALVAGSIGNFNTTSGRNVLSPNGTFIATAHNFQNGSLTISLSAAGICSGKSGAWTGLTKTTWLESARACDDDSGPWTSNSSSDGGDVADCTVTSSNWLVPLQFLTCDQLAPILCIHDGPTNSPTQSPTVSVPTVSPTTTHTPTRSPVTSIPTRSPSTSIPTRSPSTSIPTRSPTTPTASTPTHGPTTSTPTHSPSTSTPTKSPLTSIPTHSPTRSIGPTPFNNEVIANISPALIVFSVFGIMLLLLFLFHLFFDKRKKTKKRKYRIAHAGDNDVNDDDSV